MRTRARTCARDRSSARSVDERIHSQPGVTVIDGAGGDLTELGAGRDELGKPYVPTSPPTQLLVAFMVLVVAHAGLSVAGMRGHPTEVGLAFGSVLVDVFLVTAVADSRLRLAQAAPVLLVAIGAAGWAFQAPRPDLAITARAVACGLPLLVLLANVIGTAAVETQIAHATNPDDVAARLDDTRPAVIEAAVSKLALEFPPEACALALEKALARGGRALLGAIGAAHLLAQRPEGRDHGARVLARAASGAEAIETGLYACRALESVAAKDELVSILGAAGERSVARACAGATIVTSTLALAPEVSEPAVRALAALVADAKAEGAARHVAAEALAERTSVLAAELLRSSLMLVAEPTLESLSLLGTIGAPNDAPIAARFVASDSYAIATVALEAVEEILDRDSPRELAQAATRAALSSAKERLRMVHPEGDNRLADGLVERIDALATKLAP